MEEKITVSEDTLKSAIEKIEAERQVLLDTIDNNNKQIKLMDQLEEELHATEIINENLQNALFAIIYNMKKLDGEKTKPIFYEVLSNINTITFNSLLNAPIKEHFEEETIKGGLEFQKTIEKYHDHQKREIKYNVAYFKEE